MPDNFFRLWRSGVDTVAIAITLVNYNPAMGAAPLASALGSPGLKQAVSCALRQRAAERLSILNATKPASSKAAKPGSPKPSSPASSSTGSSSGPTLPADPSTARSLSDAYSLLQKHPDFRLLGQDLQNLKSTFSKSVVGTWIDVHSKSLIIVGSGVALAGATAMYITKSGDMPAQWTTQLVKGNYPLIGIGKVNLGIGAPVFVPSTRTVGGTASLKADKLGAVKEAALDLKITESAAGLRTMSVGGSANVDLSHGWAFTGNLSDDIAAQVKKLTLGINFEGSTVPALKLNLEVGGTFTKAVATPSLGLSAERGANSFKFDFSETPGSHGSGVSRSGEFTFSYHF